MVRFQTHPDSGRSYLERLFYLGTAFNLIIGVKGFEPLSGGTKNRCLTTWRHPSNLPVNIKNETIVLDP